MAIAPNGWYESRKAVASTAWVVAVEALPLGAVTMGVVVATAPFGVFVDLDQSPDVMALFDLATWPRGRPLPAVGVRLQGRVVGHRPGHDGHPGQLRLAPLDWAGFPEADQDDDDPRISALRAVTEDSTSRQPG